MSRPRPIAVLRSLQLSFLFLSVSMHLFSSALPTAIPFSPSCICSTRSPSIEESRQLSGLLLCYIPVCPFVGTQVPFHSMSVNTSSMPVTALIHAVQNLCLSVLNLMRTSHLHPILLPHIRFPVSFIYHAFGTPSPDILLCLCSLLR